MSKLLALKNSKQTFQIINKTETVSEILLYGAIGESYYEDSISAKFFAEELKKLPASIKEIHLRVNSPGGSVFDGMSIHAHIMSQKSKHGRKVIAYVDGLAASIASIIIMAADEVIVGDGSMVMIHKPMCGVNGNSNDHERMISILDKIEEQMISIYAKKMGKTRLEISTALAEETWYTSDEALENGLASSKFKSEDTLRLVASAAEGCPWLKNKPVMQSQNELVREKLREFTSKNKDLFKK